LLGAKGSPGESERQKSLEVIDGLLRMDPVAVGKLGRGEEPTVVSRA
jgi:hypothetical protein